MGKICTVRNAFIKIIAALVLITFVPGLPPSDVKFDSFVLKPTLPLSGTLALNNKLNNAEKLFENELKGPESLAVYKNELYTSVHGGYVVKIVNDKIVPVVKFGQKCEGLYEESKCGRPLGLTFDSKGSLFVADAYYGIYKHNLTTGTSERLVAADDRIEGKHAKLLNSVAVAKDGTLYYTISSTQFKIEDGMYTGLATGDGRLMRYDPVSKTNELLVDNLHFANGVVLSEDESFVVTAETMAFRLTRYYLKGPFAGTSDIFIDGLPGQPDNLQKDKHGFIVPLLMPAGEDSPPSLVHILSELPLIRKLALRLMVLIELPFITLNKYFPNYYTQLFIHSFGHFETLVAILPTPNRVSVLFVNYKGEVTKSLYATDKIISNICDFLEWNGYYYMGSPFNNYLARVKINN